MCVWCVVLCVVEGDEREVEGEREGREEEEGEGGDGGRRGWVRRACRFQWMQKSRVRANRGVMRTAKHV